MVNRVRNSLHTWSKTDKNGVQCPTTTPIYFRPGHCVLGGLSPVKNLPLQPTFLQAFPSQTFSSVSVLDDSAWKVKHVCTGRKWTVQEICQNPFIKWGGKTYGYLWWLWILVGIKPEQNILVEYFKNGDLNLLKMFIFKSGKVNFIQLSLPG